MFLKRLDGVEANSSNCLDNSYCFRRIFYHKHHRLSLCWDWSEPYGKADFCLSNPIA